MPHKGTPTFYVLKPMKDRMPKPMAPPPHPTPLPQAGEGANVLPKPI